MKRITLAAIVAIGLMSSCEKTEVLEVEKPVNNQGGSLSLNFDSRFAEEDFQLAKRYPYTLTNSSGTFNMEFEFDRLRYWVSNVKLVKSDGSEVAIADSYYLLEETGEIAIPHLTTNNIYPAKKREEVNIGLVEPGEYKGIKFSIGVDPKYNDNITLTAGELGILNGMGFSDGWMWFTSYIFQKLEGKMHWSASTDRDNAGNAITTKNLKWDTGSNALFEGAEKTIDFQKTIKIDGQHAGKVAFEIDVRKLLSSTDIPWSNNTISQSKPEQMKAFRDNFLQQSLTLKSAESETTN